MTNPPAKRNRLYELEMEVLEEGREWMRRRLEQKLARLARKEGQISPPGPAAAHEQPIPNDPDSEQRR